MSKKIEFRQKTAIIFILHKVCLCNPSRIAVLHSIHFVHFLIFKPLQHAPNTSQNTFRGEFGAASQQEKGPTGIEQCIFSCIIWIN